MKLSPRQIAASVAGAVAAAFIASLFGVAGTVIGVAIGSAVATIATTLIAHSIERTHSVVREVVRQPGQSRLLRQLGATAPTGQVEVEGESVGAPLEGQAGLGAGSAAVEETQVSAISGPGEMPTQEIGITHTTVEQPTLFAPEERTAAVPAAGTMQATMAPEAANDRTPIRWPTLAWAVGVVFVASLLVVTVVELLAGQKAAVIEIIKSPAPTTMPTTTTTTSTSTTSTTSTSTTSSTTSSTSTTLPKGTTTTTVPAGAAP